MIKFNKKEFRADIRRVLLSAHGKTTANASQEELRNAVNQVAQMYFGLSTDVSEFKSLIKAAVSDWFKKFVK